MSCALAVLRQYTLLYFSFLKTRYNQKGRNTVTHLRREIRHGSTQCGCTDTTTNYSQVTLSTYEGSGGHLCLSSTPLSIYFTWLIPSTKVHISMCIVSKSRANRREGMFYDQAVSRHMNTTIVSLCILCGHMQGGWETKEHVYSIRYSYASCVSWVKLYQSRSHPGSDVQGMTGKEYSKVEPSNRVTWLWLTMYELFFSH